MNNGVFSFIQIWSIMMLPYKQINRFCIRSMHETRITDVKSRSLKHLETNKGEATARGKVHESEEVPRGVYINWSRKRPAQEEH